MRAAKRLALLGGLALTLMASGCHWAGVRIAGPRGGYVEVRGGGHHHYPQPSHHAHYPQHHEVRRVVAVRHVHGPACGCHPDTRYVRVERSRHSHW